MNFENGGQLDIILGTMFSGKTTNLLSKISKMAELNYSILYLNYILDTRSTTQYSTHNPFIDTNNISILSKLNVSMTKTKTLMDLDIEIKDIIIIDEAHFFSDLIEFVNKCLDLNKYVIVAGLQADSEGNKFGKILDLIPICSNIEKLHAYCSECAKCKKCTIATYSKMITKTKSQVNIGGKDKYIPVCRFHYKSTDQIKSNIPTKSKIEKVYENISNNQNNYFN